MLRHIGDFLICLDSPWIFFESEGREHPASKSCEYLVPHESPQQHWYHGVIQVFYSTFNKWKMAITVNNRQQGLSRNASSVSFGHAEHCFLTVWTPKSLCQNLLKMTFLRR